MKKQTAAGIILICNSFLAWPAFSQEVKIEDRMSAFVATGENNKANGEGTSGSGKPDEGQAVLRAKAKTKVDFSGIVAHVDHDAATLSLRNSGKTITFDMSQPILQGYRSVGEIRQGDMVSVGYTGSGLQIRKGAHPASHGEPKVLHTSVKPRQTDNAGSLVGEQRTRKNIPVRMRETRSPSTFQECDNNKDGKVTAIELSVLISDLTSQRFKECDKNGDGFLDESEFRVIQNKQRR